MPMPDRPAMTLFAASVSHLRVRRGHESTRVTYVELFYDLVFVSRSRSCRTACSSI